MFTSFSTALSALSAHSTAVDVVGNNLANLNTPGYKASVVSFRELVAQSLGNGMGELQVGVGVGRPVTIRQFSQGAIQTSTGALDAAIQGDGFFIVRSSRGTLFTRAGNFQVDAVGNLLTQSGEAVQGWMEDSSGVLNTSGTIGDIVIPVGTLKAPIATRTFSVDLNLNARGVNGQPDGTFTTPVEVVDSLGVTHVLTLSFTKTTTANQWDYKITIPGADVGSTDPTEELTTGTVTFDSSGKLTSPPSTTPDIDVNVNGLADGAANMALHWGLYTATLAPRLTQFSQLSAVAASAQDGSVAAGMLRVTISDGGKVVAQYSNGQQRIVGQLALASIRNPESLVADGNNNFHLSARSAVPAIGLPDTGGRGAVIGSAIESSTVDIAREFTNLIVFQRAYQANSRVVVAVDELSQETINLKR